MDGITYAVLYTVDSENLFPTDFSECIGVEKGSNRAKLVHYNDVDISFVISPESYEACEVGKSINLKTVDGKVLSVNDNGHVVFGDSKFCLDVHQNEKNRDFAAFKHGEGFVTKDSQGYLVIGETPSYFGPIVYSPEDGKPSLGRLQAGLEMSKARADAEEKGNKESQQEPVQKKDPKKNVEYSPGHTSAATLATNALDPLGENPTPPVYSVNMTSQRADMSINVEDLDLTEYFPERVSMVDKPPREWTEAEVYFTKDPFSNGFSEFVGVEKGSNRAKLVPYGDMDIVEFEPSNPSDHNCEEEFTISMFGESMTLNTRGMKTLSGKYLNVDGDGNIIFSDEYACLGLELSEDDYGWAGITHGTKYISKDSRGYLVIGDTPLLMSSIKYDPYFGMVSTERIMDELDYKKGVMERMKNPEQDPVVTVIIDNGTEDPSTGDSNGDSTGDSNGDATGDATADNEPDSGFGAGGGGGSGGLSPSTRDAILNEPLGSNSISNSANNVSTVINQGNNTTADPAPDPEPAPEPEEPVPEPMDTKKTALIVGGIVLGVVAVATLVYIVHKHKLLNKMIKKK